MIFMNLNKGAKVFKMDGKELGRLSRFVLDPKTKNVNSLVFQSGLFSDKEYVIPMRLVDHVDETGIHLGELPVTDPKDLPRFLENEFIITDERALLDMGGISADQPNSYYYYPPTPLGGGNMMSPNELMMNTPGGTGMGQNQIGIPISGEPPVIKEPQENIPKGTVSVKEGSKVYASDGQHIGNVERIFADSETGRMTHLIISKGLLLKERKQIPVEWVSDIIEDEVHLAVDAPFVDRLPDWQP
jgi:sporulation protein YlmC with PRC-barrel domain